MSVPQSDFFFKNSEKIKSYKCTELRFFKKSEKIKYYESAKKTQILQVCQSQAQSEVCRLPRL